ncbi:MAG TPA: energy transducer TonB [Candidatus Sulfotelmatobacter sp.]
MDSSILFADSLVSSRPELARRGWSTLTSFALQALVATVLLLLSIFRPTGLPSLRQISTPISLGEPQPLAPAGPVRRGPVTEPAHTPIIVFRQPSQIRSVVRNGGDESAPTMPATGSYGSGSGGGRATGSYGSGSGGGRDRNGVSGLFNEGAQPLPSAPPKPAPSHLRLSHIDEGNLIRKVQPIYPALARSARIQGVVLLQAMISKEGTIENLRVLSGHPMLTAAAIDAVRQWRYRPYVLNGAPVEVETQITVNFSLAGN